jgi:peptidoglycan/xylan/chitin deacetylase (PgdA/CDA1 family)
VVTGRVTLTFDNGPTPGITDRVLAVLAKHDVKSTFFACGKNLGTTAEARLVERAHDEGHWIGNHTFSHSFSLGDSDDPAAPAAEIGRTQKLLGAVAHADRLFRPSGGGGNLDRHLLSRSAVRYLEDEKYTLVLWNNVPMDWADPDGWEITCRRTMARQPWSVVVLHDTDTGAMAGLDRAVGRMLDDGIDIVQDFPPDCVPMRRGLVTAPIDHLVSLGTSHFPATTQDGQPT